MRMYDICRRKRRKRLEGASHDPLNSIFPTEITGVRDRRAIPSGPRHGRSASPAILPPMGRRGGWYYTVRVEFQFVDTPARGPPVVTSSSLQLLACRAIAIQLRV